MFVIIKSLASPSRWHENILASPQACIAGATDAGVFDIPRDRNWCFAFSREKYRIFLVGYTGDESG
jgi:hypothetical protein